MIGIALSNETPYTFSKAVLKSTPELASFHISIVESGPLSAVRISTNLAPMLY
jgi:hypothetical protein